MKIKNKSDLFIAVLFFKLAIVCGILIFLKPNHRPLYYGLLVLTGAISGYKSGVAFGLDD